MPATTGAHGFQRGAAVVWTGMRHEPLLFGVAVLGGLVYGVGTTFSGWVLGRLSQDVLVPGFGQREFDWHRLTGWLAVLSGVAVLTAAGVMARRAVAGKVMYRLQGRYRQALTTKYLSLSLSWHRRRSGGKLLSVATSDVEATWQVFSPLPMGLGVVAMLVTGGAAMLASDLLLGTIGLCVLPALAALNWVYQRRIRVQVARVQGLRGDLSTVAHESFEGAHLVRGLGAEDHETERFGRVAEALRQANIAAGKTRSLFDAALDALPSLGVLAVLVVGTARVAGGVADVGDVVQVTYLIAMLSSPIRSIGWVLAELSRASIGWERLHSVLAENGSTSYGDRTVDQDAGGDVELVAVDYRHPCHDGDVPDALSEVNLRITAGRTVAIVGPTGSGKSTLVHLLARLADPVRGRVLLDGVDLRDLRRDELRRGVVLVSQETSVLDETVRDNVTLGGDWDDDAVWRALETVRIADFVSALPAGLDTSVGEQGVTLSGGQRQRLALARAVIRSPRLLVLDEATSAIDPHVEAEILTALANRFQDTTVVLVANRMATLLLADEVVYLEAGRVRERGDHAGVLARSEGYRQLVSAYDQDRRQREEVS